MEIDYIRFPAAAEVGSGKVPEPKPEAASRKPLFSPANKDGVDRPAPGNGWGRLPAGRERCPGSGN